MVASRGAKMHWMATRPEKQTQNWSSGYYKSQPLTRCLSPLYNPMDRNPMQGRQQKKEAGSLYFKKVEEINR